MSDNKNESIADLMEEYQEGSYYRIEALEENFHVDELKYDTSWEWLMLAVEYIENILIPNTKTPRFKVRMDFKTCFVQQYSESPTHKGYDLDVVGYGNEESKLKSVYTAVIEFAEWYKENRL